MQVTLFPDMVKTIATVRQKNLDFHPKQWENKVNLKALFKEKRSIYDDGDTWRENKGEKAALREEHVCL